MPRHGTCPGASTETRKKIIRLLVKEIIVDVVDDTLALIIHCKAATIHVSS